MGMRASGAQFRGRSCGERCYSSKAVSMANLFSSSICKLPAKLSEQVSLASAYRTGEAILLRSYK
jgi:hypothetical protein